MTYYLGKTGFTHRRWIRSP